MNRTQSLLNKLNELQREFNDKNQWTRDELSSWHNHCILIFEKLNIREKVIDNFSGFFNSHMLANGNEHSLFMSVDGGIFVKKPDTVHLMTIGGTFQYAREKIELIEEEERLIPKFVMEFFESGDKHGDIYTALSSIERAVSDKNIESLESSSNTLLDSVLNRVEELSGMDLGKKLGKLTSDPQLLDKVAMRKEMIIALNNSRVIRNLELIHPKENIRQTIPYICAISYAYLVILQLKIMMNVGIFEE